MFCVTSVQNTLNKQRFNQSFVSTGFTNWKEAPEEYRLHEISRGLKLAKFTVAYKHNEIELQLANASDRKQKRKSIKFIKDRWSHLSRQSLAIKGHEEAEDNFFSCFDGLRSE